ncbi:MFS transporter [Levilactobacillus namurensis]|uniref:MFS transporter n=1 Tax=Levilactobacillus namurensis TaxID=380393 RepID=A0AAW8W3L9_9LACO|nr:MFS transporter [Levilactobacillus namurensis]MDT7013812.1 MFS transporter [Levilactobacillus namurensis]
MKTTHLPTQVSGQRRLVFTAAFIIIFCCSASAAFSVFANTLVQATGATASQVALTLTIYQFFMAAFGIISGRIIDHSSPKKLMYVGGAIFGLGWFLGAFAHSLWFLYFSIGILAGTGNGLLYNPALLTTLKWFPEKRGTISGLLLGAASLGPLVLAKAGAWLCATMGAAGLMPIGATYLVLVWLVGWLMASPETPTTTTTEPAQTGKSPKEMMRSLTFWLLLALFAIACTAGIMLIGSLSAIAQVQLALTPIVAANFVVVNTLANFFGRMITGRAVDHLGETKTLFLILCLTIIGLAGLRWATGIALFTVFLIILGASFGGVLVVFPTLTGKTFGAKFSGTNYGIMFFGYAIGALIGPQIATLTMHANAGAHAYYGSYLVAIGVAVVGILIDLYLMHQGIGRHTENGGH